MKEGSEVLSKGGVKGLELGERCVGAFHSLYKDNFGDAKLDYRFQSTESCTFIDVLSRDFQIKSLESWRAFDVSIGGRRSSLKRNGGCLKSFVFS